MLDKLKADFDGILELVNKAPAPLQETAFKMILEQWFATNTSSKPSKDSDDKGGAGGGAPGLPDKVIPFMTSNGITNDILAKAYHPLGAGAQLTSDKIEGNGKAPKLVNLAVLLSVKHALEDGEFKCTLADLRQMADHYDCYDATNFSKTLSGNKNFKPRAKGADLELAGPGFKKAAELIKAIATAE